ncbi:MAG: rhomboid family intramembrane serine protease [Myxococcaceae bacterium]|nr:rhomboid family intramembrane serine protease [Myxococcaceae bacterium]
MQLGWVTSFFLHFGWLHLLGNLLFLYITAPLLEDAWGRTRFLVFYLLGGLVANAAQYALSPHAAVSIAGASGAIAACMGAFSVRFAASKVRMMYFIFLIRIWVGTAMVPAWLCGVAWFARELLDLGGGGAEGVATGAHVGGFALGAAVALGMRALGFEKELRTAEEAELHTQSQSDLMESAAIAAARGELESAKESLVELLKLMPGREDAEGLLAEVELRLGNGSARLERHLRKLMGRPDAAPLVAAVLHVWPHVDASRLSSPFCLQLARALHATKNPRLEPMLEPLLTQAGVAGGRLKQQADALLQALGAESKALSRSLELDLEPEAPTATPVQLRAVSREGLTLISGGTQRVVPFSEVLAVHAGVAPVEQRRVLFVDLVVRRSPPLALRLTSDDPTVPALFPGTPVPQAWRTFITKLVNTSKATALPADQAQGLATFESPDAVTASWAAWARA